MDDHLKDKITKTQFIERLHREQIDVLFRESENGFVYGVTFVDHIGLVSMKGSDVGARYSTKELLSRFAPDTSNPQQQINQKITARIVEGMGSDFEIKTLVKKFAQHGVVLIAENMDKNNIAYKAGHIQTLKSNYVPVDARTESLLTKAGMTLEKTNALSQQSDKYFLQHQLYKQGSPPGLGYLESVTGSHISYINDVIDTLFPATELYEEINYEFIKDSRRKRKRKRSR